MRKESAMALPFDPLVARAEEATRGFNDAILLFMSMEDRNRWMLSAFRRDLRVFQVGYFQKAYGHIVERTNLDEGVWIYCVDGKGRYAQGGTQWTVCSGDLLYCFPRTHHKYEADEENPWTIYWMHASGNRMDAYRKLIGVSRKYPVIRLGIHLEVIELFKGLYKLFQPRYNEAGFSAIYSCAQHILATLASVPRPSSSNPQWVREIQACVWHMNQSVSKRMKLEDFAEYVGLSPFHFSRRFKDLTGVSPMKYFNYLKIRKACVLLESSTLKVKSIAEQLGFENECYFSRCFKKAIGTSPESYCRRS